jgi:hypothetical protein
VVDGVAGAEQAEWRKGRPQAALFIFTGQVCVNLSVSGKRC